MSEIVKETGPVIHPMPPGYLRCKRRIALLKRFQNLIRHNERWGHEIQFAAPLEELLPPGTRAEFRHLVIAQEINKQAIQVYWVLHDLGIEMIIIYSPDRGVVGRTPEQKREYNLITDYAELSRLNGQENFEMIMSALYQGIGYYESVLPHAYRQMFNPFYWLVVLVRSPITILEHAGLAQNDQVPAAFLRIYAFVIMSMFLVFLAFLCFKLGISIPWGQLIGRFL